MRFNLSQPGDCHGLRCQCPVHGFIGSEFRSIQHGTRGTLPRSAHGFAIGWSHARHRCSHAGCENVGVQALLKCVYSNFWGNHAGMLIGHPIAILHFLEKKITAEERRVVNRLFSLCALCSQTPCVDPAVFRAKQCRYSEAA